MRASSEIQTRRANAQDASAIALAHTDSIRSIGPAFYPPDVVEAWGSGLTPDVYVNAMEGGEAFFIATGTLDGRVAVLGFEFGRGEALLMSGRSMPCVFMRKTLRPMIQRLRAGILTVVVMGAVASVLVAQSKPPNGDSASEGIAGPDNWIPLTYEEVTKVDGVVTHSYTHYRASNGSTRRERGDGRESVISNRERKLYFVFRRWLAAAPGSGTDQGWDAVPADRSQRLDADFGERRALKGVCCAPRCVDVLRGASSGRERPHLRARAQHA